MRGCLQSIAPDDAIMCDCQWSDACARRVVPWSAKPGMDCARGPLDVHVLISATGVSWRTIRDEVIVSS